MSKQYDEAYFKHWYAQGSIGSRARLHRKVALALAMTETILERPVRTVLDIGCGEGVWRAAVLKMRPKASYLGFDSSTFCIERFGRARNLHLAQFQDFAHLRPCAPVDLLVCSDVLHYLPTRELDAGLPGLAELCAGVAYLETFCREDDIEGDVQGFQRRPAEFYRKRFADVGFTALGAHCWLSPRLDAAGLTALERGP